jgi:hypothetical protein
LKILLLNQVFYPDVVATAQYLSDLAAALAARGHEVTVVSSRRAYEHPETIFPARETWRGVKILRIFSTRFGKKSKWRRAADFASFLFCSCVRLLFLPRHDVVVALTTPPLISFLGAWRAKLWRARFCYWVMDFNPDEAIAAGWLRADSFVAKFLERLSRFSLCRADHIIALDCFMRDRIVAKGIAAKKVAVIPPWSQDGQIRFDAAGRDAETQNPQVLCLPYQPLAELSGSLSAADAQVVVMGDAMLGLVHPCKIYNILTVGAPVLYIGPESSHVTEILANMQPRHPWGGARHGAVGELVGQIRQLRTAAAGHERLVPAAVELHYSQAALLPRLVGLIESEAAQI